MCRCCNYPWSCEGTPNNKARSELATQIRSHGQQEEFHQKQNNGTMQHYHKNLRLELTKKSRQLYGDGPYEPCQKPALCDSHRCAH